MKKLTLLSWHDYLHHSGFGNVAKNLLKDAHLTFDWTVIAINGRGANPKLVAAAEKSLNPKVLFPDPAVDQLGVELLLKAAEDIQPDIIFLFQDIFHIEAVIKLIREKSPKSKIISYFPIDGYPLFLHYKNIFEYSDVLITYSDWAIDVIKEFYPNLTKPLHKLYHGVNFDIFKPLPKEQIKKLKEEVGWADKFVICNVNQFQPRKQIDLSIRAFSMFAKGYSECKSCDHTQPIHFKRCELCGSKDLKPGGYKKEDVHLYLHMPPKAAAMGLLGTDHLISHVENAGLLQEDYEKKLIGINASKGHVPDEIINQIYNGSDVNLSTSIGEGCGLSLIESAAVGIPSIAPINSAIPEMLGKYGTLIDNAAVANFSHDNGHIRPLVDPFAVCQALEAYYKKWKASGKKRAVNEEIINRAKKLFSWDDKREFLFSFFTPQ